jgi:hypothetical protein
VPGQKYLHRVLSAPVFDGVAADRQICVKRTGARTNTR